MLEWGSYTIEWGSYKRSWHLNGAPTRSLAPEWGSCRSLALEWGSYKIRAVGIAPGPIAATPGLLPNLLLNLKGVPFDSLPGKIMQGSGDSARKRRLWAVFLEKMDCRSAPSLPPQVPHDGLQMFWAP